MKGALRFLMKHTLPFFESWRSLLCFQTANGDLHTLNVHNAQSGPPVGRLFLGLCLHNSSCVLVFSLQRLEKEFVIHFLIVMQT